MFCFFIKTQLITSQRYQQQRSSRAIQRTQDTLRILFSISLRFQAADVFRSPCLRLRFNIKNCINFYYRAENIDILMFIIKFIAFFVCLNSQ